METLKQKNPPTHDQAPRPRSNQAGQPSDSHQQARGRDPAANPQRREQATLLQSLTRQVFRRPSFLVSTLVGERKVFALLPLRRHSQDSVRTPACLREGETSKVFSCAAPRGLAASRISRNRNQTTLPSFKTFAALHHKDPQFVAPQGLATRQHPHFTSKAQTGLGGKKKEHQQRLLCRLNSAAPLWQTPRLLCARRRQQTCAGHSGKERRSCDISPTLSRPQGRTLNEPLQVQLAHRTPCDTLANLRSGRLSK